MKTQDVVNIQNYPRRFLQIETTSIGEVCDGNLFVGDVNCNCTGSQLFGDVNGDCAVIFYFFHNLKL